MAKLRAYSSKIREIPVYNAAVVLHPRWKWDYFDLGIEQGDWTIRELDTVKETVQLLLEDQYRVGIASHLPTRDLTSTARKAEPGSLGLVEEEEEHHGRWQAKRPHVTPCQSNNLTLSLKTMYIVLVFQIRLTLEPQMMPIRDISNHPQNLIFSHLSTIGSTGQSLQTDSL